MQTEEKTYITAPDVCKRFSISQMSLWRWIGDEKLQFPRPLRIRNRRFFRLDEIQAFEARQRAGQAT